MSDEIESAFKFIEQHLFTICCFESIERDLFLNEG